MRWFILFVGVVALCFTLALVFGLIGGGMSRATTSLSHEPLPDDELHDLDLDELRFDVGLRGYRMNQVDGVIDRLRRELRERDEHITVLRGDPGPLLLTQGESPTEGTDAVDGTDAAVVADEAQAQERGWSGSQAEAGRPAQTPSKADEQGPEQEQSERRQHSEPRG